MNVSEFIQCNEANFTHGRRGTAVDHLVIHYTGTDASAHNNLLYFSRNSAGASAHYFIDRDGTLFQSVDEGDTAWHAGDWQMNLRSIGIENVSAGEDFTDAQVSTLREVVRELMAKYDIPAANVIRHYDVTGKLCPAPYVDASKWATLHATITGGASAPTSGGSTSGRPAGALDPAQSPLLHDGYFGPLTVRYLQQAIRAHGYYPAGAYVIDGDFGYYTKLELQKLLRALGYYTTAYLLDGDFGPESTKALQRWLLDLKCYWDENGWCLVDGEWGNLTTIAIQRAINAGVL